MTALDATHRQMLDGIRYSIREITDELADWADNAYERHGQHGTDPVGNPTDPDPIALAVHLKVLTQLARDAAQARDHLASLMASDVRKHPKTFAEPIEGIGMVKVGADSTKHEWDNDAIASRIARAASYDHDTGEKHTPEEAAVIALRCAAAGWRVTDIRALGIDPDPYRTTTHGTPRARIEG